MWNPGIAFGIVVSEVKTTVPGASDRYIGDRKRGAVVAVLVHKKRCLTGYRYGQSIMKYPSVTGSKNSDK